LVTVVPIPVASVTVTPASVTLAVGKTTQLSAGLRDARGTALPERPVQWSSSAPAVATVSAAGVVSAVGEGTATITATVEGASGKATVTVPAPPAPPVIAVNPPDTQRGAGQPGIKPGAGQVPESQPPAPTPPVTGEAAASRVLPRRAVAAGGTHTCGISQSGAAVCWGSNAFGQLGDPAAGASASNPVVVQAPGGFTTLAAGGNHSCGLTAAGTALCWGQNTKGQLGSGRTSGPPTPVAVAGNRVYVSLAAGARHTCGLSASDGVAWCWGDNDLGQLGDGSTRGANAPRRVAGSTRYKALAAGSEHTCGLATDGRVFCWGDGFSGQLGRGARESQSEPVAVEATVRFTALAAGGKHTCALAQNGKVYCWGANVAGEVGDGSKAERSMPVAVSGTRTYVALTAGPEHTCALADGGTAFCWGRNRDGQLGDGSRIDRPVPVRVAADDAFTAISAGATHSCAVTRQSAVVCWGANAKGQLGDGTATSRATPAAVEAPR
jgi:alpha-tubulin suppressor-like RCC1 family protein